jgi:aldehyde:ferredoxin oxidoreductase
MVRWCATAMEAFGKPLAEYSLKDLKENFYRGKTCSARCTVGCVRTASAYDEWRGQSAAVVSA